MRFAQGRSRAEGGRGRGSTRGGEGPPLVQVACSASRHRVQRVPARNEYANLPFLQAPRSLILLRTPAFSSREREDRVKTHLRAVVEPLLLVSEG